jgi:uncharacterized coiled-coil DUF342 family protein
MNLKLFVKKISPISKNIHELILNIIKDYEKIKLLILYMDRVKKKPIDEIFDICILINLKQKEIETKMDSVLKGLEQIEKTIDNIEIDEKVIIENDSPKKGWFY